MAQRNYFPYAGASADSVGDAAADFPASKFEAVTPDDDTDISFLTRGLYIGGAGDVGVLDADGNFALFIGVVAGTILPIRVSRVVVHEPGSPAVTVTTATNMVALT